jgi:hypothetical protein
MMTDRYRALSLTFRPYSEACSLQQISSKIQEQGLFRMAMHKAKERNRDTKEKQEKEAKKNDRNW